MAKTLMGALTTTKMLQPVPTRGGGGGGWVNLIREPFTGAWQRNMELSNDTVLAQTTVFSCVTMIAGDIAKVPWGLREYKGNIWVPTDNPAYSAVLRKPNTFQNDQQFRESWQLSKMIYGNALILKGRDQRGVVNRLWVLNWRCVQPLVTDSGDVYYRLNKDPLSNQYQDDAIVPASEVIHDRFNTLFHPLIGLSPLYAAASVAGHSLEIQSNTTQFFGNGARPSGILTAPGRLESARAKELKAQWDSAFGGENAGKVAVLGDGLSFTPMQMTSTDAQLIEQLKWDAEEVARAFHVPGYMVGVGAEPSYNNAQALILRYYGQCLQPLMEAMERCLGDGLSLDSRLEVHLSTDALLRMDTVTQMDIAVKGIGGGVFTPNEARNDFNLPSKTGGDAVYLQQQNYSIEALAARDATNPLAAPAPAVAPVVEAPAVVVEQGDTVEEQRALLSLFRKGLGLK